MRLLGFERVELQPGESCRVTVPADPWLLARFDGAVGQWRIAKGTYKVALRKCASDFALEAEVPMVERLFGR